MRKMIGPALACLVLSACAVSPVEPDLTDVLDPDDPLDRAFLNNHFSYCDPANGYVIVVPAGFRTDHTSIPFPVSLIFPRKGRDYVNAAYIHDYLYGLGLPDGRDYADRVMLRAMTEYDVDWLTRHIIYIGIRLGGSGGYGLESDWVFLNPDGSPRPSPPRPAVPYRRDLENCDDYEAMVISGELFDGPAAPYGRLPSDAPAETGPDQP